MMKKITLGCLIVGLSLVMEHAMAQIETPAPSPFTTISQTIGLTEFTLEYSRPGVKDREIFGSLVPYGEAWRTGANAATKLTVSDDVKIGGKDLAAGTYLITTIPTATDWTWIFSTTDREEVMRTNATSEPYSGQVESMFIGFDQLRDNSAIMALIWDKTMVALPIEVTVESSVMAQIDDVMANPYNQAADNFYAAAGYYYSNDKDMTKAHEWISEAVKLRPDAFWMSRLKSQIEAKKGDYKTAIATAEMSKAAAEKAGNKQFVQMNETSIAEWKSKK